MWTTDGAFDTQKSKSSYKDVRPVYTSTFEERDILDEMQTTLIDDITLDYDNSSRFDKYAVTFQIFYETVFGQTVAVIGSTK